jgi:GNAT superfamily N-acetyltransferase
MTSCRIRPIDAANVAEIQLVAQRMRQTLIEVLGEARGSAMYSLTWLEQRVRWHLDSHETVGEVFLAETLDGAIVGHTIVRVDKDDAGAPIGLFSTIYVDPAFRNGGVAKQLLTCGEAWMVRRALPRAVTYTDADNIKLQNLFIARGYIMKEMPDDFV